MSVTCISPGIRCPVIDVVIYPLCALTDAEITLVEQPTKIGSRL